MPGAGIPRLLPQADGPPVIAFIARRFAMTIPTLVGMSMLIFLLVRFLPGDVVDAFFSGDVGSSAAGRAAVRKSLGLADPLWAQYAKFVGGLLTGDFGKSYLSGQPVALILGRAIPITLELTILATIFAVAIAVPLGVVSAVAPNSGFDLAARVGGLLGLSIPNFWVATLGLLVSSLVFHWVPAVTWVAPWQDPLGNLAQMALPTFAVALYLLATVMRMTRASLLEVLREDFVRTARAKGVPRRVVVIKHGLRNALIPVITVIGTQIGNLMGGTTIVEVIFGLPGMGYTLVQSIYNRDYPVIQVAALFLAAIFVFLNLAVDLLYGVLDPRVEQT